MLAVSVSDSQEFAGFHGTWSLGRTSHPSVSVSTERVETGSVVIILVSYKHCVSETFTVLCCIYAKRTHVQHFTIFHNPGPEPKSMMHSQVQMCVSARISQCYWYLIELLCKGVCVL